MRKLRFLIVAAAIVGCVGGDVALAKSRKAAAHKHPVKAAVLPVKSSVLRVFASSNATTAPSAAAMASSARASDSKDPFVSSLSRWTASPSNSVSSRGKSVARVLSRGAADSVFHSVTNTREKPSGMLVATNVVSGQGSNRSASMARRSVSAAVTPIKINRNVVSFDRRKLDNQTMAASAKSFRALAR
jgi:hypothetical protein